MIDKHRINKAVYLIVGGEPDGNGGGVIDTSSKKHEAEWKATYYTRFGYRDVRVMTYEQFMKD